MRPWCCRWISMVSRILYIDSYIHYMHIQSHISHKDIIIRLLYPHLMTYINPISSDLITYHQVSSDIIRYHQISSDTIWYHLISSDTIWYHLISFDIDNSVDWFYLFFFAVNGFAGAPTAAERPATEQRCGGGFGVCCKSGSRAEGAPPVFSGGWGGDELGYKYILYIYIRHLYV